MTGRPIDLSEVVRVSGYHLELYAMKDLESGDVVVPPTWSADVHDLLRRLTVYPAYQSPPRDEDLARFVTEAGLARILGDRLDDHRRLSRQMLGNAETVRALAPTQRGTLAWLRDVGYRPPRPLADYHPDPAHHQFLKIGWGLAGWYRACRDAGTWPVWEDLNAEVFAMAAVERVASHYSEWAWGYTSRIRPSRTGVEVQNGRSGGVARMSYEMLAADPGRVLFWDNLLEIS